MIQKLEISYVHSDTDPKLEKYIQKKLGQLDRYIPRAARPSAHLEIRLKENTSQKHESHKNGSTCEATLHLPNEVINISECTINMYAATDIVEQKLKQQIMKYKELHGSGALRRRLAARFSRRPVAQPAAEQQ